MKLKILLIILLFTTACWQNFDIPQEASTDTHVPPVEVVSFEVYPDTIRKGESAFLSWKVLGADTVDVMTWNVWHEVKHEDGHLVEGRNASQDLFLRATNRWGTIFETVHLTVIKWND